MNILFPTDYSDNACNAFQFACYLAEKFNANIEILHVYPMLVIDNNLTMNGLSNQLEQLKQSQMERVKKFVEDFKVHASKLPIDKINIRYQVLSGDTVVEICNYSNQNQFDLIVMGTKGATNSEDLKMGTVTSNIIAKSKVPVLAIPAEAVYQDIQKIALAEDFEKADTEPIELIKQIAKLFNAYLSVLHISEVKDNINQVRTQNYYKIKHQNVRDLANVSFDVVNGRDKVLALDQFIEDENVDLLAMVSRNPKTAQTESLLGQMVLHADIPILAFPNQEAV